MPSNRPKFQHAVPPWVSTGATFFITICTQNRHGAPLLLFPEIPSGLLHAAAAYHSRRWWCRLWLVMPDHVHGLVSMPSTESLTRTIGDWKRYTSKQHAINWQDNFFDHRIRTHESLDEKAAYIRANPIRAGLIGVEEIWPWIWEPTETAARPVD